MSDIQYAYPLILNKVASPQYVTPTLRRGRLLDWLHENAGCRALVIAADAGYGKTTLLWQWEREADFPCYWYKLDRNDRDWTLHISYLIEAISQRHEDFGRRAHSMMQQMGGPGSSRPAVAGYLLAEMQERLTEPCTFIVDDWQYVNAATEVRGLWNQILRDAPPTCRFVFASRGKPQLQFARFKTHAGYAELRTGDIRLTNDEIEALFRDVYENPLTRDEIDAISLRTEGWAASLQLIEVSLRDRPSAADRFAVIDAMTATSDSDLFSFLAEEVLDQQTAETQTLLLSTSVLQQVTPELAERLAGVHDGQEQLRRLEQNGLFIQQVGEGRYRYHGLFRDFLHRSLVADRSSAEVGALHIHAASYFETTQQWPEAIHHYLEAGLQRQAARLIARYGETIADEGRIGLSDRWLRNLPPRVVAENARLSLLFGEMSWIRGDFAEASGSLQRARRYFAKKGDHRMEALACLKLSTLANLAGQIRTSAEYAREGLLLAPHDARSLRLRLEGNLAVTAVWLSAPLIEAMQACLRVAGEAQSLGLEHYAAIGMHNAGILLREMGRLDEGREQLERAASCWAAPALTPYGENAELVDTLLALGRSTEAHIVAESSLTRTRPWKRPYAEATCGRALVDLFEGRFGDAIERLLPAALIDDLGATTQVAQNILLDALILDGRPKHEIAPALEALGRRQLEERTELYARSSIAVGRHVSGLCDEECGRQLDGLLGHTKTRGGVHAWLWCSVKMSLLALAHRRRGAARESAEVLKQLSNSPSLRAMRWWVRRFSPYAPDLVRQPDMVTTLGRFLKNDPEHWRRPAIECLPRLSVGARETLIDEICRTGNRETVELLRNVAGDDVADARRILICRMAPRLFVRGFGALTIHRGAWDGPVIELPKKRVRALVGLMTAFGDRTLTRDVILEILWPDASASAGVNSLNQTVYQLRRMLDADFREGNAPPYVLATTEVVQFNRELVNIDFEEVRRLARQFAAHPSADVARKIIALVRGQFLADLRYEDWAWRIATSAHSEIRDVLLPIAQGASLPDAHDLGIQAACALMDMDEFDEAAVAALVRRLASAGRKAAAHESLSQYIERVRSELGESPSADLMAVAPAVSISRASRSSHS